jgi:type I restriction enzyme S subunit
MSNKAQTTTPKPDGKPTLTPKLRFPEFSAPWQFEPLSKVLKEHKIKNTAGRDVFSVSMESGIVNQIEHLGRSYAAADTTHYTVGRRFDVVYTKSPLKAFPFGVVKQCKFNGEVALSPLYGVFTPLNPHVGLLIEAYFESPNRSKAFLSPLCQKGAKNTLQITNTTFLSGRLPLPKQEPEQQKIAECLYSVDELITAQARKLDALKTHKKGLMQQLFPREGETQPRLRFPEFQNAEEWDEKPLKEVLSIFQGFAFSSNDSVSDGVRWLKIADVSIQQMNHSVASYLPIEYREKYEKFSVKRGEYVIALTRPILGKQLKMAAVDEVFDGALLNQRVGKLITSQNISFVYFLLQTSKVINDIEKSISGTEPPNLSAQQLEDIKTYIPAKSTEQQRIADCLTSLDDLIAAQFKKLVALKTHKKGLMQQLFPSPGGVEA